MMDRYFAAGGGDRFFFDAYRPRARAQKNKDVKNLDIIYVDLHAVKKEVSFMYCPYCGSLNPEANRACDHCGKKIKISRSKLPIWYKFLLCCAAVLAIFQGSQILEVQGLTATIENQLTALRSKKISEAYYEYGSNVFQETISLKAFKELINLYPVFQDNFEIALEQPFFNDNIALVHGTITGSNRENIPITYEMTKEENKWKVASMQMSAPGTGTGATAVPTKSVDFIIPIDGQLRALRNNDIPAAYELTTKEFQNTTSLDEFISFVKKNPILTNHQKISVKSQQVQEDKANLIVELSNGQESVSIQYVLSNEGGKWKIWSMNALAGYPPAIAGLLKDPDSLKKPIEGFLQALKDQNLPLAYYTFTSKEFQASTPFEGFRKFVDKFETLAANEGFELKHPVIDKGTGTIEVALKKRNIITNIDFTLGIEENQWKIWAIQVVKQQPQPPAKKEVQEVVTEPSLPEDENGDPRKAVGGPLQFTKIELGNKIDEKGAILNPQTSLTSSLEDIYVNLYVRNGMEGDKIEAILKHVETQSELAPISTTLQQEGNSVISFSFSPPAVGWPKGTYQLRTESSTGVKRTFTFVIE